MEKLYSLCSFPRIISRISFRSSHRAFSSHHIPSVDGGFKRAYQLPTFTKTTMQIFRLCTSSEQPRLSVPPPPPPVDEPIPGIIGDVGPQVGPTNRFSSPRHFSFDLSFVMPLQTSHKVLTRCIGCGVLLQATCPTDIGYVPPSVCTKYSGNVRISTNDYIQDLLHASNLNLSLNG